MPGSPLNPGTPGPPLSPWTFQTVFRVSDFRLHEKPQWQGAKNLVCKGPNLPLSDPEREHFS